MQSNANIVTGSCPNCGMPVAAEAGVTSGTCPYCGDPIPAEPSENINPLDPGFDKRVF